MLAKPNIHTNSGDGREAPGRPSLLTPAVRDAVVAGFTDGLPTAFAAAAGGVCPRTLRYWLASGRRGDSAEAVQFLAAVKKARAEGVAARLRRITAAAGKHWQADAWVLERTYPEVFGTNRRELRELRKQLTDLGEGLARLAAETGPADSPGSRVR